MSNISASLNEYIQTYINDENEVEYYSTEDGADYFFNHKKQNDAEFYEVYFDDFRD